MRKLISANDFRHLLCDAVANGSVTKKGVAKKFFYTVRTVERWMDGTRTPALRLTRREIARFLIRKYNNERYKT